jgi:predicted TPR repeat methyltransferase
MAPIPGSASERDAKLVIWLIPTIRHFLTQLHAGLLRQMIKVGCGFGLPSVAVLRTWGDWLW